MLLLGAPARLGDSSAGQLTRFCVGMAARSSAGPDSRLFRRPVAMRVRESWELKPELAQISAPHPSSGWGAVRSAV
jgi:hypothetical protein